MKKNLVIVIVTVLVTTIVFVGIMEVSKSMARAKAKADLARIYPTLKDTKSKIAVTITANSIIQQNKSWFGFSNSSANQESEEPREAGEDISWIFNWYRSQRESGSTPNVETSWGWYNPQTGEWTPGK